jgi:hypothetical protein
VDASIRGQGPGWSHDADAGRGDREPGGVRVHLGRLFSTDRGIPTAGSVGSWAFDITAVILAVLGVLEARVFWRRVT